MKTDNLINAIVQDALAPPLSLAARMFGALVVGGAVAGILFASTLGVRSDIGSALATWRFLLKVAVTLISFALAWVACVRLARPETSARQVVIGLAIAPAVLAVAVGYELMTVPSAEWFARTAGLYARTCLLAIPLLSLVPLAALLMALRAGAPRAPAVVGAVAGLLAGALGAVFYATHCPDDSPLFVAVWYTLAMALVVLIGSLAGHRVLRW